MKIVLQADILQKKLSFLNRAISSRTQLPILSTILFETNDGKLQLSSTDLEIGIQTQLPCTIKEEGAATIPARTFTELINSLSTEEVTLQTTEGGLQVITKHTKSLFQTMNASEFPRLFEEKGEKVAVFQSSDLKKDFSYVIFAASTDTARAQLTGVLVEPEEKGFLLVATDGYRLSLRHNKIETLGVGGSRMIVPARVFREVMAFKDEGGEVHMYIAPDKNQVLFELPETILVGRLIEGSFPTYEKIIPTDHASQVTVDREELLKAVKICSIFARESANIVKFSLKEGKIIVSSQTPTLGENTVEVEAALTGEENEIAFNARYLLDVLSILEEQELMFEMTGPLNPGVFKLKADPSFLHLIMPIRLQQ